MHTNISHYLPILDKNIFLVFLGFASSHGYGDKESLLSY